jgi:outer membrane protein, adhesin transport system
VAFNDVRKLNEQLGYLDRNVVSIQKARDAYRQQFDIGQRSLLDLLNAENEVYTARRAYANAEYDLGFAFARTHAAMNQLSAQLGVAQIDNVANDASGWDQGDDAPTRCPVLVAEVIAVDHDELDARAARMAESAPKPVSRVPADTPINKP